MEGTEPRDGADSTNKVGELPPGWYPSQSGGDQEVFWDGSQWLTPLAPAHERLPTPAPTSGLAVGALVAALVVPVVGLVLGYVARRDIERSGGSVSGRGLATVAIVLGWVWMAALGVLLVIAFIVVPRLSGPTAAENPSGSGAASVPAATTGAGIDLNDSTGQVVQGVWDSQDATAQSQFCAVYRQSEALARLKYEEGFTDKAVADTTWPYFEQILKNEC